MREEPTRCELRITEQLHRRWAGRFEGFALTHESEGTATLRGTVVDQAALHGVARAVQEAWT